MKKALLFIHLLLYLVPLTRQARAQTAQTVQNGQTTSAISLPVSGCVYNWVNNTPGIGLPASGTGNIPSFTAINNGNTAITATITATAAPNAFAYVVDGGANIVEVVSLVTNQVILGIPVGESPGGDVVSPDGSHVYVTNSASGSISVISTATNSVTDTVPVGTKPTNIAISPDGKFVYVVNSASKSLSVVNTGTNTVATVIQLKYNPYDVIISPDGTRAYVDYGTNATALSVINTATQKLLPDIPLNENCAGIAISPDGLKLYMTNYSGTIAVVNTATYTETAPIPLVLYTDSQSPILPYSIACSADGSRLYAVSVSSRAGTINVINTATNSVADTIGTPAYPAYGICLTADGAKLIVVADAVLVINTSTYAKEAYIRLGNPPATSYSNYVTGAAACANTPLTFTFTVTPTPLPPAVITAGGAAGIIYGCAGDASFSPDIEQFSLAGAHLKGNITATAPAGFEISLSPTGGYAATLNITASGGQVNTTVYVRSAATDATGSIAGTVTLSSPGAANQYAEVSGTVNPLPTMQPIPNQAVNNGQQTAAVDFPGNNIAVNWVNDTPGIGLAANGVGDIPVFTAVNNTDTVITATITATPVPAPLAYVTNTDSNNISVINTMTDQVINTINTPQAPQNISASPDGSRVYFIDDLSGAISAINTSSNAIIATIPVDFYGPLALVVSPDGSKVYVSIGGGGNYMNENITVINTATNTIATKVPVAGSGQAIAVSPDGSKIYLAATELNEITVIDAKTYAVIKNIPVGIATSALALSPNGKILYAADAIGGVVYMINTTTYAQTAEITVSQDPVSMAISPDGSRLYVVNDGFGFYGTGAVSGSVSVIDAATNKVVASIPVGASPQGVSITPDGKKLYVVNSGLPLYTGGPFLAANVSVINTANNTVTTNVTVGKAPDAMGNFISPGVGCSGAPVKFTIKVKPSPRIAAGTITGNIVGCQGAASVSPNIQQFTVSASNLTGNVTVSAPAGFEISLSEATGYTATLSIAPQSGAVNNVTVFVRLAADAPAGTSNGTITLSAAGAAGQNVVISGNATAPVSPSVNIAASATNVCAGTSVAFTATDVNAGEAPGYQWAVNGINAGSNSAAFSSSTLADGDVVSCTLTSNAPCATPSVAVSNSITMKMNPLVNPSVSIEASETRVCAGTPVTFTATPVSGGDAPVYQWLVNGVAAGGNGSDFTDSQLANGDAVSCKMTSNATCTVLSNATSNLITIAVDPLPTVNAGADETINETASTQLNATTTGDITGVTWSPAEGLSNNKILNPVASPKTNTTYVVTVATSAGCTASDTVVINVILPPVIIPNTFTPNGDGINDTWDIKFLDLYINCSVQIFTRWGARVYNSIGYRTAWNGTYNNAKLPDGTYYYIIDLGTHTGLLSGFVTIIK